MPPSNTIGMDKGRAPRAMMVGHMARGTGASRGMLRRVAMKCTTAIINSVMHKPGSRPPKNKAPTEAPDTKA